MAIVIRLLERGEQHLANDFFNSIYKSNRSLEDFRWEFENGPAGPAVYIIAVDDAVVDSIKVVGIQCAIPLEFVNTKGETFLTAKSEDTLVDPDYRGQKIFERMYELLFSECEKLGIHTIWGFTPAKKAFERIGFQIPFQAHQGLMVFNPTAAYTHLVSLNPGNRLTDKVKIAGLSVISMLVSVKSRFAGKANLSYNRLDFRNADIHLEKFYPASSYLFLRLSQTYLDWRINKNPFGNNYEGYEFLSEGNVVANVIVNFKSKELGYIEQIAFAQNVSNDIRARVLRSVVSMMRARVKFIRVLCFETNAELKDQQRLLETCGFIVLKRGGHFVWKVLGKRSIDANEVFLTRLFTQGNQ